MDFKAQASLPSSLASCEAGRSWNPGRSWLPDSNGNAICVESACVPTSPPSPSLMHAHTHTHPETQLRADRQASPRSTGLHFRQKLHWGRLGFLSLLKFSFLSEVSPLIGRETHENSLTSKSCQERLTSARKNMWACSISTVMT